MWQATPVWSTSTSTASPSQSSTTARTAWVLPLVAPLRHSSWRERLQNHVSPRSRVRSSDSRFIQAWVSTRPVAGVLDHGRHQAVGVRSAPAPTARRRALRSRRRLRRHQAFPFSAASSTMTATAERGADARGARADHRLDGLERAHAAGRLDPHALGQGVAHQLDVVHRRGGAAARCRSWRSRRPTSTTILQASLFTLSFRSGASMMTFTSTSPRASLAARPRTARTTRTQIVPHALEVAREHRPVVHDHVELVGALGHRAVGLLGALERRWSPPPGEVDDRAGLHVTARAAARPSSGTYSRIRAEGREVMLAAPRRRRARCPRRWCRWRQDHQIERLREILGPHQQRAGAGHGLIRSSIATAPSGARA